MNEASVSAISSRRFDLDCVRALAIISIVVIHTTAYHLNEFSPSWHLANALNSFARIGVPVFFMLSGALLVPREEPLRVALRRAFRVGIIILIASLIFLATGLSEAKQGYWLPAILREPVMYHLWFLYVYLFICLTTPVLSLVFRHATRELARLMLCLWALTCLLLPTLDSVLGERLFAVPVFIHLYVGYVMVGAYIDQLPLERSRVRRAWRVYILATLLTILCTWLLSQYREQPVGLLYNANSPFVAIAAAAFFIATKSWGMSVAQDSSSLLRRAILSLSRQGLWIYVFHVAVLQFAAQPGWITEWQKTIPGIILLLGGSLIVLLISYVLSLMVSSVWRLLRQILQHHRPA